jgi:ribulose-phosphate 3-epimerase
MVDAGADLLTFHVEAVEDPLAVAGGIRDLGVGVGIAINPGTPMSALEGCLGEVDDRGDAGGGAPDMVLVMSVAAGFGGQSFNPVALSRIADLRARFPELLIQIDGGINPATIGQARTAGCDLFVVGSAIFGKDDYGQAIAELKTALVSNGEAS